MTELDLLKKYVNFLRNKCLPGYNAIIRINEQKRNIVSIVERTKLFTDFNTDSSESAFRRWCFLEYCQQEKIHKEQYFIPDFKDMWTGFDTEVIKRNGHARACLGEIDKVDSVIYDIWGMYSYGDINRIRSKILISPANETYKLYEREDQKYILYHTFVDFGVAYGSYFSKELKMPRFLGTELGPFMRADFTLLDRQIINHFSK